MAFSKQAFALCMVFCVMGNLACARQLQDLGSTLNLGKLLGGGGLSLTGSASTTTSSGGSSTTTSTSASSGADPSKIAGLGVSSITSKLDLNSIAPIFNLFIPPTQSTTTYTTTVDSTVMSKTSTRGKQLADGVNSLTQASGELSEVFKGLTFPFAFAKAPEAAAGFARLVASIVQLAATAGGTAAQPLGNDDAVAVVAVLKGFVTVHQQLLSTVIGKKGVIALLPLPPPLNLFTEAVRQVLVQLEVVVDTFALWLINLIPTQKDAAMPELMRLNQSVVEARVSYSS